jgi:D-alanine-D-alanine ligase-like ATP-grasp enzyme
MATSTVEKVVGVLRGGHPVQFERSLYTGQHVLDCISDAVPYAKPLDIFVDQSGVWHVRGMPVSPERALRQIDVLYNALTGGLRDGDGFNPQRLCELHHVRYTGPRAVGAAVGNASHMVRRYTTDTRIKHPLHKVISRHMCTEKYLAAVYQSIPGLCIVYPARSGVREYAMVVETFEDVAYAVAEMYRHGDTVVLEQYLEGEQYSVVILEHYRGEMYYAFPPIHAQRTHPNVQHTETLYTYQRLTAATRDALLAHARSIHQRFFMRDYSQVDFLLRPEGVYVLQVHPVPALGAGTAADVALATVGTTSIEFVTHVYKQALSRTHM